MKNIILTGLLAAAATFAQAQSNELIGQYNLNLPLYNPAHTGADEYLNITTGARRQWTGFGGSPYNSFLSGYGVVRSSKHKRDTVHMTTPKHGIGGYIMSNGQGPYKQTEVAMLYAYHVPVAKGTYLSLGMSPSMYTEKIDVPKVTVEDVNDAAYQSLINQGGSHTTLRINAGLGLYSDKFYFSYSLREAVKASVSGNKPLFDQKADKRHHFMAGYTFSLNHKLDVIPNTFLRLDQARPALVEFGVRVRHDQNKWAGISYRNDKTVVGSIGLLFKDKFQFGYAFEYKNFGLSSYSSVSHEILLGIQLFRKKKISKYASVREAISEEPAVVQQEAPVEEVKEVVNTTPEVKSFHSGLKSVKGEILTGGTIEIKNLTTGAVEVISAEEARVKLNLTKGNDYQLTGSKEGYVSQTIQVPASEIESKQTDALSDIVLKKVGVFKKLNIGETIEMNIRYDVGKADMKNESMPEMDKLIEMLQEEPSLKIEIGSHTDARGSDEANYLLSQKRAESAVKYLVSKGIDPSRLQAKGYGERSPKVADAATEADHALNRRTTIRITGI